MKILLPVDGSECSKRAVQYVIAMVREFGPMPVHVLHVQEPVLYIELLVTPTADTLDRWTQKVGRAASQAACTLLDEAGVPYALDILDGEVGGTIARHAREGGFNLIVMGTHGRSALPGLVLGSVVTKVIHHTQTPVTLVK